MNLIILSGLSGAGKSTEAKKIVDENPGKALICSADHFFYNAAGEYKFNGSQLSLAHGECFRMAVKYCLSYGFAATVETIIVDNTNLSSEEIAPYYLLGQSFGRDVEIRTFRTTPLAAFKRNVHGLSFEAVEAQFRKLGNRKLPPYWKNVDIGSDLQR